MGVPTRWSPTVAGQRRLPLPPFPFPLRGRGGGRVPGGRLVLAPDDGALGAGALAAGAPLEAPWRGAPVPAGWRAGDRDAPGRITPEAWGRPRPPARPAPA